MKKIDIRIKRTYSQLIAAFLELLKNKSFDDISVSEICEAADVHRATFYKHFNDKYEFLNFCLESLLEDIEYNDAILEPTPENIKNCCTSFIKIIFEFIHKYRYVFKAVFTGRQSIMFNKYLTDIITSFCIDKIEKVLVGTPPHKIELLSNFYSGAVIGVAKWYVTHHEECPLEDVFTFFEHRIVEISDFYEKHYMNDIFNNEN